MAQSDTAFRRTAGYRQRPPGSIVRSDSPQRQPAAIVRSDCLQRLSAAILRSPALSIRSPRIYIHQLMPRVIVHQLTIPPTLVAVVFSHPPLAVMGLTEEQAIEKHGADQAANAPPRLHSTARPPVFTIANPASCRCRTRLASFASARFLIIITPALHGRPNHPNLAWPKFGMPQHGPNLAGDHPQEYLRQYVVLAGVLGRRPIPGVLTTPARKHASTPLPPPLWACLLLHASSCSSIISPSHLDLSAHTHRS